MAICEELSRRNLEHGRLARPKLSGKPGKRRVRDTLERLELPIVLAPQGVLQRLEDRRRKGLIVVLVVQALGGPVELDLSPGARDLPSTLQLGDATAVRPMWAGSPLEEFLFNGLGDVKLVDPCSEMRHRAGGRPGQRRSGASRPTLR